MQRTLSVRSAANSQTQLLSLTRQTFNRILGSIKKFLKEDYAASSKGNLQVDESQSEDG